MFFFCSNEKIVEFIDFILYGKRKGDYEIDDYFGLNDYCGTCFLIIITFILLIINIIIFSVLCSRYSADDFDIFLAFLECPNVNNEIFGKYSVLNDLTSHFTLLKIFHSFYIIYILIFLILTLIMKCHFTNNFV